MQMFDHLILTSSHHMELAFRLQKYFKIRNDEADHPGLLEEEAISKYSFSARYAALNEDMLQTIKLIGKKDEKKKEEKRIQYDKTRAEAAKLREGGDCTTLSCNGYCDKCKLKRAYDRLRVKVYRSIWMRETHERNALAFELRIPIAFACLRDVLYLFVTTHYDSQLKDWPKCLNWCDHAELSEFALKNRTQNVSLGTTSKKLNQRTQRGCELHPEKSFDEFIDTDISDYNFLMCGKKEKQTKAFCSKMPIKTKFQSIKKFVTFSVQKLSEYAKLQWALESTAHTQNSVLAKKSDCPPDLSIAEYINFGSLRADGHRLQHRNLYRVLSDEGLSFETPSVLALVMQTLWEAGPETKINYWYRESNDDFVDDDFVQAMADLLEAYIERQQCNWRHPLKLMVAIIIVCRMFEINSDMTVAGRLAKVLLKFRLTAIKWIANIKVKISESNTDGTNRDELYANVTDVAICGALTFFVNRHHVHFSKIFHNTDEYSAVKAWLLFNDTINHYNALCQNNPQVFIRLYPILAKFS